MFNFIKSILYLLLLPNMVYAFSCHDTKHIIEMPIVFDDLRIQLTREYQFKHYGIQSESIQIEPRMIVLHWTETRNLIDAFASFNSPLLNSRPELPDKLNVSAQYLVDRDGTIYQLMPADWMARHVIGLNHSSIGIENVGGVGSIADLTEDQARSNAFLVCHLKDKYPTITYLIGHMEYLEYKNTPLWLEKDPNYQTIKLDPGSKFMERVKALID